MTEENQNRKREKYRDILEGHTKAQHQRIIVRGKANAITIMGPKVTLLLAITRGGFLNCHLFKNGGRGTKPTYIFLVIIPLSVIELKATPNGNPSDDFYWRQNSALSMLCNIIPPVGLLLFTYKSIQPNRKI